MLRKRSRNCEICCIREMHSQTPVFFARFPLDDARCREWIRLTGREDLVHLPIEKLHTTRHVCGSHFSDKDFNKKRNRLKRKAIPSLNLKAPPLTDEQMAGFPLHVHKLTDHTFSKPVSEESPNKKLKFTDHTYCKPPTGESHNEQLKITDHTYCKLPTAESHNVQLKIPAEPEAPTSLTEAVPSTSKAPLPSTSKALLPPTSKSLSESVSTPTKKNLFRTSRVACHEDQKSEMLDITPRKRKLINELKRTKCTLKSLKKGALLIEKIESPILKEIIINTCKNEKRKPKGRRWTSKHKLSCLAILKRSPKVYRYLCAAVSLPSVKTLKNILKKIPMEPGINKSVLNHLKKESVKGDPRDKMCCLIFDEMAIKPRLIYNEASDLVEGYVDLGEFGRTGEIADHALVFMLQGLKKKFKQPIAFYFTKGTISSAKLAVIIRNIICEISKCGFTVLNTVCDQGPTNMGALKILKQSSGPKDVSDNVFIVNNKKVFVVFDVPHLFKSIRNNFLNAGILKMNGKIAKWVYLEEMELNNRNFLYLSKITQAHVNLKYRAKMRVKLAAQLLSNTTSAVLKLMSRAETGDRCKEMLDTAHVVEELDKLFDLTNGPSGPNDMKKGIRVNVSQKSNHLDRWAQYVTKLEGMQFISKDGVPSRNVKCIQGYITTLKSLRDIWQTVEQCNFKYLNLRNLNQDALENLFGVIRQHSPTNRNPTAAHFTTALKTAVVTGLTAPHSKNFNCEKDNKCLLTDFNDFVFGKIEEEEDEEKENTQSDKENEGDVVENVPSILHIEEEEIAEEETDFSLISEQPKVYVSGYLAKKLTQKYNCIDCQNKLIVKNPTDNAIYSYIFLREWWQEKFALTYPTENLCQAVDAMVKTTENDLCPKLYERNISLLGCTLYSAVSYNNLSLGCIVHEEDVRKYMYELTSKMLIRRKCHLVNVSIASSEEDLRSSVKKAEQYRKQIP